MRKEAYTMNLEQVKAAKDALEAEGRYPSADAVLTTLGFGSKRDVVRLLRELAGAPEAQGAASATAVAEETPAPGMLVPLRQQAQEARAAEIALGLKVQALETGRLAEIVRELVLTEAHGRACQTKEAAAAIRAALAYLQAQKTAAEQEKRALMAQRATQGKVALDAEHQYRAARQRAQALVTTLRRQQREARDLSPWEASGVEDQVGLTLLALSELVGEQDAQQLHADPTYRPAWLQERS
jgi:ABC-type uncharacterized transport system permease subunit